MIAQRFVDDMLRLAQETFPNEACGLLAVDGDFVTHFYAIDNADASPVHYRMDSQQQLKAMLDMEEQGWELGAVFHSHTRTRAYPSETDIRLAYYPDALYVILSLASQRADVRGFRIGDGQITEVPLEFDS